VVCTELLQDLLARGSRLTARAVRDRRGQGAAQSARRCLGDAALIQRCQLHKGRNLDALVPKTRHAYVRASCVERIGRPARRPRAAS